jgi:glucose-1-phosphate thymidylyltransferase
MKGIILHGGHGTRLRPLTHTGPKQLLPIANKPMSEYCVETLANAGIEEIAFIIGGIGSKKVKEYYGEGDKFGVKFTYIQQDSPKGIAHAISLCEDFVDNEKFVVFLGDNIIQREINDYILDFEKSDALASLLLCEVDNPSQFGIAEIENNKIIKITEKPKNPPTNLAVTGIYFLTPHIFEVIKKLKPSWRNELEIADALQILVEEDKKIIYGMITDFWKDTGTPNDIIEANKIILENMPESFKGKKEDNVIMEGKIIVGKGTIIKNGVKIFGPTIIGENCIIEGNSIIGENTSIGENSHLNHCNITNSIIMSNCIIKGELVIKNSIIASNSKITKEHNQSNKKFILGEGTQISL